MSAMRVKPRQLDLRSVADVATLNQLSDDKNRALHGVKRHEWLLQYGWVLAGIRSDGRTRDYYRPDYCHRSSGIPITLNASAAIRFQVYLNLVKAGLIKDRCLDMILVSGRTKIGSGSESRSPMAEV